MTARRRGVKREHGTLLMSLALALSASACTGDDHGHAGTGDGARGGGLDATARGGTSGASGAGGAVTSTGGNGGTAGAGGQGGGAPLSQIWKDFSTALCHHYLHCYGENYGGSELRAMGGAAECATALESATLKLHSHASALREGVTVGTLSIQTSSVQACLDAVASCDYPLMTAPKFEIHFEDIPPCREVFEGTVANGGDCDISEECVGDAMCLHGPATPGACSGTCQPRKQAGEACSSDRECGAPSPTAWSVCQEGKCLVVKVNAAGIAGAECGRAPTTESKPCGDDLWCPAGAFGLGGLANCATPIAAGMPCDTSAPYSSECQEGRCVTPKCTSDIVGQKVGDSCANVGEICDSFASLACDTGKCVKADGAAGSPCNSTYWFEKALCPPVTLGTEGSSCSAHDSCASGICRLGHGCVSKLCSAP